MSKLSLHLESQKKIAEIRTLVEVEAKKLQNAVEAKDSSLRDIQTLTERKSMLVGQLADIEKQIKVKEQILAETIEKKTKFIDSAKTELKHEKSSIKENQKALQEITKETEEIKKVAKELKVFIKKAEKARLEYLKTQEKLGKVQRELQEATPLLKKEKEEIKKEKKDLDVMKDYVNEAYGKLASYTEKAKETLEYVNEHLKETGTPLVFRVPEGQLLEINIDNFDKI